ncbi:glycosyltransferase family 4 protein [Brevundimonas aurifodinae]|uniref:Glycosyltransferase family 4 protein n=2 Tax=Brevundimonas TaxID=41275 RepID=A0ABV1NQM4_9CAUL|nr:MAG: glycosyl transferase family 1 [Brevundimonas sp. 12-68-7]OYX33400.1 MAG: glycosyl transferase family 1 [Brevundimonas subvibrioides]
MKRLGIYHPAGRAGRGANVFGMQVANVELFQAVARYGGLDRLDVLTHVDVTGDQIRPGLLGPEGGTVDIQATLILNQARARDAGAVLRGGPRIDELAWVRRFVVGETAYSLMGLIHTIAPPAMRQEIAMASIGPTHPWDAVICTSPSIQSAMVRMFDDWEAYLADRFGGAAPPRPQLPLLPLGVYGEVFAAAADRPAVRGARRAALGVGPDDVVVLWVGRLSFFEKAFPQPMFRAVQDAARATGARVHFAMVGWFPGGAEDEARYREAAAAYAPDVDLHLLDGNDAALVREMWAASDIFVSLVDNIQETFGITPLEAMAAGLPVVVSDWDGYRYTVRDGVEGALIPTLGAPAHDLLQETATSHALAITSYQSYVGTIAQHTAVHVGRAAESIAALIRSPDLRRRQGEAGRRRIRDTFDWRVVAPQYVALSEELAGIRRVAPERPRRPHPVKGDPFKDFSGFATHVLGLDDRLALASGAAVTDLERSSTLWLDQFASKRRGTAEEELRLLTLIARSDGIAVRAVLEDFAVPRRKRIMLSLMWMAKAGILDWGPP